MAGTWIHGQSTIEVLICPIFVMWHITDKPELNSTSWNWDCNGFMVLKQEEQIYNEGRK